MRSILGLSLLVLATAGYSQEPSPKAAPQRAPVAGRLTASNLEADANPTPLGIDNAKPTLSWQLSGPGRGIMQTRYRILVASTSALAAARKGDLWDTGPVVSDSTSVTYAGKALASRARYYWTVQVTTKDASAWAPIAWFETAYLTAGEWQGAWISGPSRYTERITAAQGAADDACCVAFNTTLHEAAQAGATNIKVVSISAIATGVRFNIGGQSATVMEVGTAASTTTLAAPAASGATNVKVAGVTGFEAGQPIAIGSHRATMSQVGRAAVSATLSAAAAAGATEIRITMTAGGRGGPGGRGGSGGAGIQAGDTVIIDGESRTVVSVVAPQGGRGFGPGDPGGGPGGGAPPAQGGAQAAAGAQGGGRAQAAAGAAPTGGAAQAGGRQGGGGRGGGPAQPTTVTITPALTSAHAPGAAVQGLGTGITFAPALASATPQGAAVSNPGTGVNFTPALRAAAAAGAAIARVDQPVDYCRPPGSFSNSGTCRAILPNYMLRKAFAVDPVSAHGKVVSARIYSTGLGWNDMTLNGSKTEPDTWMNPGFTAYDQTVLYTTDDVTALIQQDASKPKTNIIASQLAAGRYNSTNSTGGHAFEFAQWRAQEVLRADLYVKYADGTEQLVKTDPSWKVGIDGPVRVSDYFDGETFDARRQIHGWNTASYDASGWANASVIAGPKGRIYAQPQEPSQLVKTIPNKVNGVDTFPMWQVSDGVYGVDTLKQRAGQPVVSIWGAASGQVIRVVAVERRNDDGLPTTINNRQDGAFALPGGMSQQYYISNGTGTAERPEVFAPVYNVQGFQWVLVDAGSAPQAGGGQGGGGFGGPGGGGGSAPLPAGVKVHVDAVREMRTNMAQTGTFTSSNALLDKIHEAVRGGVAVNHVAGQITDTPTYERDGWTGDSQLMAPSASYLFDTQRHYIKSAQDAVDSQAIGNTYIVNAEVAKPRALGAVGLLIPSAYGYGYCSPMAVNPYGCGNGTPSNSFGKGTNAGATPIWDAFLHVLPFEAYRFYNDIRPAATAYDAMSQYLKSYIPYWMKAYTENIDKTKRYLVASGLGDWAAPRGNPGSAVAPPGGISDNDQAALDNTNFSVETIGVPSGSAYMAYMFKVTAELAAALGKTEDAAYFKTIFENVKKDYNAKWWDASVGYYRESPSQPFLQSMQAIPLGMGLVDEANRIPLETKLVQDVLVTRKGHEEVGIAGSRWIFPVLTQAARDGVPDAARAAYAIALQTTYPSYGYWVQTLGWTGIGEYWEAGSRTRTHEMYGSIVQWMYEELAGIQAASSGFKTINIRPLILNGAGISSVAATYSSVRGRISSAWTVNDSGITLDLTIPANTTATIYVPGTEASKVTESGVLASRAPGVAFAGTTRDAVKYTVGSGTYHFSTQGPAPAAKNTVPVR